jgi:hypothetical protein
VKRSLRKEPVVLDSFDEFDKKLTEVGELDVDVVLVRMEKNCKCSAALPTI